MYKYVCLCVFKLKIGVCTWLHLYPVRECVCAQVVCVCLSTYRQDALVCVCMCVGALVWVSVCMCVYINICECLHFCITFICVRVCEHFCIHACVCALTLWTGRQGNAESDNINKHDNDPKGFNLHFRLQERLSLSLPQGTTRANYQGTSGIYAVV